MKNLYAVEVWVEDTQVICVAANDESAAKTIAVQCARMDSPEWGAAAEQIERLTDIPAGWEHMHPIEGSCTCTEWFEEPAPLPDPRQLAFPDTDT